MTTLPLPPLPGAGAPAVRHPALAAVARAQYTSGDVARVRRQLQALGLLTLPSLPNGLHAANPAPREATTYTGYGRTWVRDTVQVAEAAWEMGELASVRATCASLLRWYQSQAPRMEAVIAGRADLDDPMQRPHVRFDGEHLRELEEPWPHIQNDAHGYALWLLSRAALSGLLPLDERAVAALARFPAYFAAIRYWADRDSGHWEEQRRLSCASVGAVLAGLSALRGLLRSAERKVPGSGAALAGGQDIDGLIGKGRQLLDRVLPWETAARDVARGEQESGGAPGQPTSFGVAARPAPRGVEAAQTPPPVGAATDPGCAHRQRRADAALLFLIHPLRVVSGEQADAILANVRDELVGPFGVRRYLGDSYWCADYARLFDEATRTAGFFDRVDARDAHLIPGTEAQWCLFDPVLSTIFGFRYLASREPHDLALQSAHFNRALSQVTGPECRFGPGLCPESYYLANSRQPGTWVVNDATPLLWTQAWLGVSLSAMERSAGVGG